MLVSFIANTLATLSIFPILSFVLIYFGIFLYYKDKKLALYWSINITTFLILISVYMTVQLLWSISILWLILLLVFIIIGGLGTMQYRLRGDLQFDKLLNGTIRLMFLLFFPIHLLLLIWVVIGKAIEAAI